MGREINIKGSIPEHLIYIRPERGVTFITAYPKDMLETMGRYPIVAVKTLKKSGAKKNEEAVEKGKKLALNELRKTERKYSYYRTAKKGKKKKC